MSVLTIVYAGRTHYNAEVQSFSFEANANGDVFVAASTQPADTEIDGSTGTLLNELTIGSSEQPTDPLNPDGRYSDAEMQVIRKRVNP